MNDRKLLIFVDTSVFGGCEDEEFWQVSLRFFEEVKMGKFKIAISDTILFELGKAPQTIRDILSGLGTDRVVVIPVDDEIKKLRDKYISAGIVGKNSLNDAEHIAAATIAGADVIVSWNFKHIVNFDKIRSYQGINIFNGYNAISIYSPREVVTL
jgi:hypothetical protein